MRAPDHVWWLATLAAVAIVTTGCDSPPDREMNQAQGALDAASAAGAEAYAAETFTAASAALESAQRAATDRDYRLALAYALDARERAQDAAREAADQKALVRSVVETTLVSIAGLLEQTTARLAAAPASTIDDPEVSSARQALALAESSVQEARAALAREDYLEARAVLDGLLESVEAASAQIKTLDQPQL